MSTGCADYYASMQPLPISSDIVQIYCVAEAGLRLKGVSQMREKGMLDSYYSLVDQMQNLEDLSTNDCYYSSRYGLADTPTLQLQQAS